MRDQIHNQLIDNKKGPTGTIARVKAFIEHRRAVEDPKNMEERYRILFKYSQDACYLNDLNGNFVDGNQAAEEIFGYKREELIGKNFMELKLLPINQISKAANCLAKNTLGKSTGPDDFILNRKGGTRVKVEIRTYPVKIQGKTLVLGIARDITEYKQAKEALRISEDRLKKILVNVKAPIYMKDTQGRYILTNHQFEKVFGFSKDEVIGKTDHDLFSSGIADFYLANDKQVMNRGIPLDFEEYAELEDGPHYYVSTKFPMHADNGSIDAVCGISTDITERKQTEESLRRAKEELDKRVQEQTADLVKKNKELKKEVKLRKKAEKDLQGSLAEKMILLKEVHHRVKNNLQVICSLLRLQSNQIKDRKIRDIYGVSTNRVKSMAFIHDTLYQTDDFAKVDFSYYLTSLTRNLYWEYGRMNGKIDLAVKVKDISLGIDLAVPCGLVVNELVSNALKHAFPASWEGKPKVSVNMQPNGDDHEVKLVIRDNGIGIPKDINIRKTESLGLKLVNILVTEQLNGKIRLNRREGTQFHITFRGPQIEQ